MHIRTLAAASPTPAGGANQRASVEGCIGQTLFNGLWRLTVLKSEPTTNPDDSDYKNWGVTIELRNGKKRVEFTNRLRNGRISAAGLFRWYRA